MTTGFNIKVKTNKNTKQSSEKENVDFIIDEGANSSQNHPRSSKKKLGIKRKRSNSNALNNSSNDCSNHSGQDMSNGSVFVDSHDICNLLSRREIIEKNPEDDSIHSNEIITINDLSYFQL